MVLGLFFFFQLLLFCRLVVEIIFWCLGIADSNSREQMDSPFAGVTLILKATKWIWWGLTMHVSQPDLCSLPFLPPLFSLWYFKFEYFVSELKVENYFSYMNLVYLSSYWVSCRVLKLVVQKRLCMCFWEQRHCIY